MKKIVCWIVLPICLCLTMFSCQDDHGEDYVSGASAGVRVSFQTPDFIQTGTRATNESGISDVTVLQFKGGTLFKKIELQNQSFLQAVTISGLESMVAAKLSNGSLVQDGGENVIVFLANVISATGESVTLTEGSSKYTNLLAYTASFSKDNIATLGDVKFIPMTGFYYGGITDGVTNQINVTLTRALAKINFTLNTTNFMVGENKPTELTVNSISLCNVPLAMTFFPTNRPALPANGLPGEWPSVTQIPYPATGGGTGNKGDDGGYDATNFVTLTADHNQASNKTTSFIGYMPENARGSYTDITSNKEKIPSKITTINGSETNSVGLTYLLVDLDYVTTEGVIKNAKYKIYIGGDDKGDMNILANAQYNITTYLYGANTADTRITVTSLFNSTIVTNSENDIQKAANCYMIDAATSIPTKFTIPLSQARNGWRYITASLGQDYVTPFDEMIVDKEWEIVTLWKTWNTASTVTGTVSTGITTEGINGERYYATLEFSGTIPNGNNCVIALKEKDVDGGQTGTTWWSWHLWFTDYKPDAVVDNNKKGQIHTYFGDAFSIAGKYYRKKMMDRHLGATGSVSNNDTIVTPESLADAIQWYGLLYEWGRKDPFTSSRTGTNVAPVSNATIIYNSDGSLVGNAVGNTDGNIYVEDGFPKVFANGLVNNLANAVNKPMVYYYNNAGNYNWTAQDDNLWGNTTGEKTVFDPCPPGWRVPVGGGTVANNPWAGFYDNNPSSVAGATNNDAGKGVFPWVSNGTGLGGRRYAGNKDAYDVATDKAWYPASGHRYRDTGAFASVGVGGLAWNSAVTGTNGYGLFFHASYVNPQSSHSRAQGFPVRCVQN